MENNRVLIIAEAGVNHNGNLDMALQLVEAAANAGADLVKFQTFSAERLATRDAPKANYQLRSTDAMKSQFAMLQQLELDPKMHEAIIEHCQKQGIGFFSTGFDILSLNYLESLGMQFFKIPSGEITNLPYLRYVGSLGKRVLLSTGMATLGEIEAALDVLENAGLQRRQVTILHCNTEYPTPMADVNLRAMCNIGRAFGVKVGYSDHTKGIEVPIAAVAMGATVIEKHLTIDRNLEGPDHKASLEPFEFGSMVSAIRNIELAMGDGVKRPSQSEIGNKSVARKSVVASRSIRAGELFSQENLSVKRPGTGLSPMRWDELIGHAASRDYEADEQI